MALIKCKGCGHTISDSAYECPKCGTKTEQSEDYDYVRVKTKSKNHKARYVLFTIVMCLCVIVVILLFVNKTKTHKAELEQEQLAISTKIKADSIATADSIAWINFSTPDLAYMELHGHVKECLAPYSVQFDHNGNFTYYINEYNGAFGFTRNKDGYISKIEDGMMGGVTNLEWDNNRIIRTNGYDYNGFYFAKTYKYDKDGIIKEITKVHDEEGTTVQHFINYKFDEFGNWIYRDVVTQGVPPMVTTEQRVITYYER